MSLEETSFFLLLGGIIKIHNNTNSKGVAVIFLPFRDACNNPPPLIYRSYIPDSSWCPGICFQRKNMISDGKFAILIIIYFW